MTYVSRGDRIFTYGWVECTWPVVKRSDARLKRFSSIYDERIWSEIEERRYQYLYQLMNGSKTCLTINSNKFNFVPLEEIINVIVAEKDEYIKCLEDRLGIGVEVNEIYKAGAFKECEEDDESVHSMKNKIANLTAELEESRNARNTLRQAMHKLEDIEDIVNENQDLKRKLRCSEEMVKFLEEKKSKLEKELDNLRTKSEIEMDLNDLEENLRCINKREKCARGVELCQLKKERDNLERKVCELQKELCDMRTKQSELELLRKNSESATMTLEELVKENECYKQKLVSMKSLEEQIQELKKQASVLANKYKGNQDKQFEALSEERDKLRKKVQELECYESQYNALQCKLRQVDVIIAENEMLNCKLSKLDKLELENELLRCKLEQCQASELEAAEGKERIRELQCAVADQEEEMKDLLCQIERLSRTYVGNGELDRLKQELSEKDDKLRLCEEQLAEIPLLEAEIDELRCKLEECCRNLNDFDQNRSSKDQEPVSNSGDKVFGTKFEDTPYDQKESAVVEEVRTEEAVVLEKGDIEKGGMTCEEVQNLLRSSKGIINCVLEDMIEHQREMEELEKCNKEMKDEICQLKNQMGNPDDCIKQIAELKELLDEKQKQICCLEEELAKAGDLGKVNEHITNLECEIEYLKNMNAKMRADLEEACSDMQKSVDPECVPEDDLKKKEDLKVKEESESKISTKSEKEEYNQGAKVGSAEIDNKMSNNNQNGYSSNEASELEEMKKLVQELKKENALLKETQTTCPDFLKELEEKAALENLLNLLQNELDTCRATTLENCDDLKCEIQRLKKQNCELKSLVNCYSERLELERNSRKGSVCQGGAEENRLRSEITHLRCDVMELCQKVEELETQLREKCMEIEQLKENCTNLEDKNAELEDEVMKKVDQTESLKKAVSKLITEQERLSSDKQSLISRLKDSESPKIDKPKELAKDLSEKEALDSTMRSIENEVDGLSKKISEGSKPTDADNLADLLKKQQDEIERLKKELRECKADLAEEKLSGKPSKDSEDARKISAKKEFDEVEKGKEPESKKAVEEKKSPEPTDREIAKVKQEGVALPTPKEAQVVPQSTIPIQEEQRPVMLERGKVVDLGRRPTSSKVEFIEGTPKELKVVVEPEKALEKPRVAEIQPAERAKEGETKPAERPKEEETKPAERPKEEETKPAERPKETETKPAERPKEAEAKPAERPKEEETKPAERPKEEETKPAERPKEAETKPAERPKEAEAKPAERPKEAEAKPAERPKEAEAKPAERPKEAEAKPAERRKGSETQPAERAKAADTAQPRPSVAAEQKAPAIAQLSAKTKQAERPSMVDEARPAARPTVTIADGTKRPEERLTVPDTVGRPSVTVSEVRQPAQKPVQAEALARPSAAESRAPIRPSVAATQRVPAREAAAQPSAAPAKAAPTKADDVKKLADGPSVKQSPTVADEKETTPEPGKVKTQVGPQGQDEIKIGPSISDESTGSISDVDSDFAKFLCTLNPENHKENICRIEMRYRQKMCELQKKNEEKVKAIMAQHEKESSMKDKMYKNTINNVKSGYESDIRKLVDRHKSSIMRLQELHENAIQELNTEYEMQIEALQTQNENIVNDLTTGATEKFKILAEQHNKDVRELERRYQNQLERKEEEYMTMLTNSDGADVADLQSKHSRDLKKIKESNLKRMDLMRHKYEDLITCERKKYEKKLEALVEKLKQGRPIAHGTCQCNAPPPCPKDPNTPLKFDDVLRKILSFGIESLDFDEIALVHGKICTATEGIVLNSELDPRLLPSVSGEPAESLMKGSKEEIMSRLLAIENQIAVKQAETQDAIILMEKSVKAERKRLEALKETLKNEREFERTHRGSNIVKATPDFDNSAVKENNLLEKIKQFQRDHGCTQKSLRHKPDRSSTTAYDTETMKHRKSKTKVRKMSQR